MTSRRRDEGNAAGVTARRPASDLPVQAQGRRGQVSARAAAFEHEPSDPGTGRLLSPLTEPTLQALDALEVETLALCITSDVWPLPGLAGYVDWRLCGRLSSLARAGFITGARDEHTLIPIAGPLRARRIFVFGWGPQASSVEDAPSRLEQMVRVLLEAQCETVAVALPEPGGPLIHLVEDHVRRAFGSRRVTVFAPDHLLAMAPTHAARSIAPSLTMAGVHHTPP